MPASPIPIGPGASGTPGTFRGDACPGALRLHAADDGFLARVRVPGGVLDVAGARALGDAARRLGDGSLHLTSRGNVQLRGLRDGCGGELAELLGAAGLLPSAAHERVRNVVASPLSGLDGLGFVDVRGWLTGLDAGVLASSVTPALSGRFLFGLDDGRGDVAGLGPDVLLRGCPDGSAVLAVGGAEFLVRYEDAARAAVVAAEVFVEAARDVSGRRVWRVRELDLPAPELTTRMAARLHAAGIESNPARGAGNCATSHDGVAPAGQGAHALTVTPRLGAVSAAQWAALTTLITQLPPGEIRLTPWKGIVVPAAGPPHAAHLTRTGLVTDPESPWTRIGACTGRPGCAKAHADVRADATARHPHLPTYWSGCERRCGHPAGPYVDVVARPDGTYAVTTERAEPRV
ncbi:cobalamin biosynthesis protein CobG [Streptomyces sp. NPDC006552]|uniref:cobalamin biosynthesis protein CobG n=1 Tax=Streptomyces sp. NPDC006552 TaxID=3157179 RepID=UPI0033B720EB